MFLNRLLTMMKTVADPLDGSSLRQRRYAGGD